ncbi:BAF_HP2_G0030090.mRNA.1.CDS.1 [Saccharomyces cerevisiae]|nr:BAF_HP2_G0030090.mRNA.1.CDS.1 [Saccharomyces cerevisiae]CAI6454778.1 BAF_HP2_G0030090.mRNA.1.CDS.1 [Saccharomyces cerevisiae]
MLRLQRKKFSCRKPSRKDYLTNQQPKKSSTPSTSSNGEFIPHIFIAANKEEIQTISNQLETLTGSIRHRLKLCKSLISGKRRYQGFIK